MFDKGVVFRREIDDSVFATINQIEIIPLGMSGDSVGSSVIILLDHHALKMIKWTCKIVFLLYDTTNLLKKSFMVVYSNSLVCLTQRRIDNLHSQINVYQRVIDTRMMIFILPTLYCSMNISNYLTV